MIVTSVARMVFIYPCDLFPITGTGALGGAKKVDLDTVPQIGGQSIFEVELDPDKPWKMPGQSLRHPVCVCQLRDTKFVMKCHTCSVFLTLSAVFLISPLISGCN